MNKREYAISLGLASPGRGRLSREAHAAIQKAEDEGMTFADKAPYIPKIKDVGETVSYTKPPQVKVRDIGSGLKGFTEQGWTVGFDTCKNCACHANYCSCKEFGLPAIVATIDNRTADLLGLKYDTRAEVRKDNY